MKCHTCSDTKFHTIFAVTESVILIKIGDLSYFGNLLDKMTLYTLANESVRPVGQPRAVSMLSSLQSAVWSRSPAILEPECLSIVLAGKKDSSRK